MEKYVLQNGLLKGTREKPQLHHRLCGSGRSLVFLFVKSELTVPKSYEGLFNETNIKSVALSLEYNVNVSKCQFS